MIKLQRGAKPIELTEALQQGLTEVYKQTGDPVWNLDFIKRALLNYASNKCCYCEADISEESKYLEVEHFHPKKPYEDEVLEWGNLLPCCKRCNGTKGDHDTIKEPIIDPTAINPKDHLHFWNFRLKSKDPLGILTISVLDLNNQDRLVKKRFEIGSALHAKIEQIGELLNEYIGGVQRSTRRKNRIVNGLKSLLEEGLPNSIYAATSATIILTDPEFNALKQKMVVEMLWDDELQKLEYGLNQIALTLYH